MIHRTQQLCRNVCQMAGEFDIAPEILAILKILRQSPFEAAKQNIIDLDPTDCSAPLGFGVDSLRSFKNDG